MENYKEFLESRLMFQIGNSRTSTIVKDADFNDRMFEALIFNAFVDARFEDSLNLSDKKEYLEFKVKLLSILRKKFKRFLKLAEIAEQEEFEIPTVILDSEKCKNEMKKYHQALLSENLLDKWHLLNPQKTFNVVGFERDFKLDVVFKLDDLKGNRHDLELYYALNEDFLKLDALEINSPIFVKTNRDCEKCLGVVIRTA